MKVILLQDIKGVGKKDEVINASDGYARNFLLPKKMALEANSENMSKLKAKQDANQYKKSVEKEEAKKVAEKLKNITLEISSALANLFSKTFLQSSSFCTSSISLFIGVSTQPGAIQFTLIFGASSFAKL